VDANQPIGVFDSGVGGLSVLREIRALLPYEELLYVADSAHVPYGNKSPAYIEARSLALSEFLLGQGAKAIVVACNTATAAAVATLRARLPVPIVGMEPAVKPAVNATRSGVVGVLATVGTLASSKFAALLGRYSGHARIVVQPCPGLVEQVELGDLTSERTQSLVRSYVFPLIEQGADTIVLGCTHYPFLRPLIQEIAGSDVTLIDTGAAVARQLVRRLEESAGLCPPRTAGEQFWTSGELAALQVALHSLWSETAISQALPKE